MKRLPYPIGIFLQILIIPLTGLLLFYPFILFDTFFAWFLFIILTPVHVIFYFRVYNTFLNWWLPNE